MTLPSNELWNHVPEGAPDAILALNSMFLADTNESKVNLGVGAYRDETGKPWILPAVQMAKEQLVSDPSVHHEYLPITGFQPFRQAAARLMFGDNARSIKNGALVTNQTISGTGANHVAAKLLSLYYPFPNGEKQIYLSDPTWPNHLGIMSGAGIKPLKYKYYDPMTRGLDFKGMVDSIENVADGSVVLLHACAHNPTGVDPTEAQWRELSDLFAKKRLFAFFDSAYQGFASGDTARDAFAVRHFEERGDIAMCVCQSFAKNAGLYGERVGALHVVTASPQQAKCVQSQINVIHRSELSTTPAFFARVAAKILDEPGLREQWERDIRTMSGRTIQMRHMLYDELVKLGTPGTWQHIVDQTGMFSYLGLDEKQCERLVKEGHIYLVKTSRISMAGLNQNNVKYVASWIDRVVREQSNL